jgi:DNA-directed RNA polymerase specialized sigma24 family protein
MKRKNKGIFASPRILSILGKPGKEWTDKEAEAVFEWFMGEPLENLIRLAFGVTRDLTLAEEMVRAKFVDAFRSRRAYDPAQDQARDNSLFKLVYTLTDVF